MATIKALILTGFGINCEEEMAAAYRLAGAEARVEHLNQVFLGRVALQDFQVLNLPGGFSFGDDLGSGKVLANKLLFKKMGGAVRFAEELNSFIDRGGYVLGICNGFQVLVKMGLLPNLTGEGRQEVTLTRNDSARFEDRWCRCRVSGSSPFLAGLDLIDLPVRHGEGKLVVRDPAVLQAIEDEGLSCMTYVDDQGQATTDHPANPNGSALACAGLQDPTGRVLGMMPHPEAFLTGYNHPDWARQKRLDPNWSEEGEGLQIFQNIVRHVEEQQ